MMDETITPVKIEEEKENYSEAKTYSLEPKRNWWDFIQKHTLYFLIFLAPLFFLPWTLAPVAINKEILVSSLALFSFFAFLGSAIVKGKIERPISILNVIVSFLGFSWVLAVIFSKSKILSIGFLGGEPDVLINFLTYLLVFFLASVTFTKKEEIFKAVFLFFLSGFIISLFTFFQFFGLYGFAKISSIFNFTAFADFNPIGSVNALALYLSALLVLTLSLISFFDLKKFLKYLFIVASALVLFNLVLINYWSAWLILAIGSLFIFSLKFVRATNQQLSVTSDHLSATSNHRSAGKIFNLSLSIFIIAVVFLGMGFINRYSGIVNFRFPLQAAFPIEISPNWQATFNIAKNVLKERPVWGSGPGTFFADWNKYRPQDLNNDSVFGELAGVSFKSGVAALPTMVSTVGLLGAGTFILLLIYFLSKGIYEIFNLKTQGKESPLFITLFLINFIFALFWFFYPLNYTFAFLTFFFLGLFLSVLAREGMVKISLRTLFSSPQRAMLLPLGLIPLMVVVGGLLYLNGQRYLAAFYFGKWLQSQSISYLTQAVNLDQIHDLYLRSLSQVNLLRLNNFLRQNQDGVSEENVRTNFQQISTSAINAAVLAINRDALNSQNWISLGQIYESLVRFIPEAFLQAVEVYKKAAELDPKNPLHSLNIAKVYTIQGELAENKEKNESFDQALKFLDQALSLKINYSPAYFLKAQVLERKGNITEAIKNTELAKLISPSDIGIIFQLGNLYLRDNQLVKAKTEFLQTLKISPNYSNARYFLGLIYDREGNKTQSQEEFEKILALNPQNQEVIRILENLKAGLPAFSF